MTSITDPHHPLYRDEADVRTELTRVFDTCRECRKCLDLCAAFPRLFGAIDGLARADAGLLTPDQQDRVGDACHQCGLCATGCPFGPGGTDAAVVGAGNDAPSIDFPLAMRRLAAMRSATGQVGPRRRWSARILGSAAKVGALGSAAAPLVNRLLTGPAGSPVRAALSAATGISATRVLPPFARQRFSTWFNARPAPAVPARRQVIVFPTCVVEYHQPAIGRDLVRVLEHNGIGCAIAGASQCCGAPLLHAGEIDAFARSASRLSRLLARELSGSDAVLVVPQPTCASVLAHEYPTYVGGPDATLVAERVVEPSDHLMALEPGDLRTDFAGEVPGSITWHAACSSRTRGSDESARALLGLTGASVTVVNGCAGLGGLGGLAAAHDATATEAGRRLGTAVAAAGGEVVVGGCQLANTAIEEHSGLRALHPFQVLARAYGLDED